MLEKIKNFVFSNKKWYLLLIEVVIILFVFIAMYFLTNGLDIGIMYLSGLVLIITFIVLLFLSALKNSIFRKIFLIFIAVVILYFGYSFLKDFQERFYIKRFLNNYVENIVMYKNINKFSTNLEKEVIEKSGCDIIDFKILQNEKDVIAYDIKCKNGLDISLFDSQKFLYNRDIDINYKDNWCKTIFRQKNQSDIGIWCYKVGTT